MSAPGAPARLHDPTCMVCGPENPNGLGLRAAVSGDRVYGSVDLDSRHGGAPGFAHGGALAAFIDDLFGYVLVIIDRPAVTAKLEVEFRAPAMLGHTIEMVAWCERIGKRKLHLRGEIRAGETLVVEASALFIHVDVSHWATSGIPLPDGWHTWGASTRPGRTPHGDLGPQALGVRGVGADPPKEPRTCLGGSAQREHLPEG